MIAGLKPYPAMKDTGVPWLGQVPEHWKLPRLGTLLRERGETNEAGHFTEVLSVTRDRGVIPYAEKGNIGNKKSDDITRYKIVRPDDIVVNCMNVIIGSVGLSRYTGCLSPVYYVLTRRSENDDPRYLNAYFQAKPFQRSLVRIGNGILAHRMRIPMELLKSELFPRPTRDEQAAIVRFLDHADRRIRRYIRAKQKLIKLLEEQKQAIIHRAVTRGLDPNVRLKPSGVEWLGDVPEHWEVLRLARVIANGPRNGISPAIDERGNIESFSISAIRNGRVDVRDADKKYVSGDKTSLEATYCLLRGDVLLVRGNGNLRLVGKAGLVVQDMPGRVYPDLLMRIRLAPTCLPQFLVALLTCRTGRDQIETAARTAVGTFKINNQQVRQLCFAFPPVNEQESILRSLDKDLRPLAVASSRAEEEIDLLREYRTRLIADVVTGKLDVREAAVRLPQEAEDLEAVDEAGVESEAQDADAGDTDDVPEEAEA